MEPDEPPDPDKYAVWVYVRRENKKIKRENKIKNSKLDYRIIFEGQEYTPADVWSFREGELPSSFDKKKKMHLEKATEDERLRLYRALDCIHSHRSKGPQARLAKLTGFKLEDCYLNSQKT